MSSTTTEDPDSKPNLETLLEAAQFIEDRKPGKPKTETRESKNVSNFHGYAKPLTISEKLALKSTEISESTDEDEEMDKNNKSSATDVEVEDSPTKAGTSGSGGRGKSLMTLERFHVIREVHNKLEKNRRAHLKECFDSLKVKIPHLRDQLRVSNLGILRGSLKQIQHLKRKEKEMEMTMQKLAREKIMAQERIAILKHELTEMGIDHSIAEKFLKFEKGSSSNSTVTAENNVPIMSEEEDICYDGVKVKVVREVSAPQEQMRAKRTADNTFKLYKMSEAGDGASPPTTNSQETIAVKGKIISGSGENGEIASPDAHELKKEMASCMTVMKNSINVPKPVSLIRPQKIHQLIIPANVATTPAAVAVVTTGAATSIVHTPTGIVQQQQPKTPVTQILQHTIAQRVQAQLQKQQMPSGVVASQPQTIQIKSPPPTHTSGNKVQQPMSHVSVVLSPSVLQQLGASPVKASQSNATLPILGQPLLASLGNLQGVRGTTPQVLAPISSLGHVKLATPQVKAHPPATQIKSPIQLNTTQLKSPIQLNTTQMSTPIQLSTTQGKAPIQLSTTQVKTPIQLNTTQMNTLQLNTTQMNTPIQVASSQVKTPIQIAAPQQVKTPIQVATPASLQQLLPQLNSLLGNQLAMVNSNNQQESALTSQALAAISKLVSQANSTTTSVANTSVAASPVANTPTTTTVTIALKPMSLQAPTIQPTQAISGIQLQQLLNQAAVQSLTTAATSQSIDNRTELPSIQLVSPLNLPTNNRPITIKPEPLKPVLAQPASASNSVVVSGGSGLVTLTPSKSATPGVLQSVPVTQLLSPMVLSPGIQLAPAQATQNAVISPQLLKQLNIPIIQQPLGIPIKPLVMVSLPSGTAAGATLSTASQPQTIQVTLPVTKPS